MKNIYLIGGGGHSHSCIDVIESSGAFKILGIFDSTKPIGTSVLGYKIIGTDLDISKYISKENYFLITVGQIKSSDIRRQLSETVRQFGGQFATVVSGRAHVSKHADLSEGTIVMHDAVVNANAKVGRHCILNTKSVVEHDAIVEDFCHISTGAIMNGNCKLGSGSFVGSLAVVEQGVEVAENVTITAGSFYRGK